MAICRPKTIGDAPEGPERSGGCRRIDFLASRGMGEAQGKKVDATALRLRRSRRSRSSARSSHHRGQVRRVLSHNLGRRWLASVRLDKKSVRFGVEKETKRGESGNRRHKARRKRRLQDCIDVHRPQSTLPHRSARRSPLSLSDSLIDFSAHRFIQSVGEPNGARSLLMRCGCENRLRIAHDCRVRIELAGRG
jgi:hypothetical protein